ncbi:hypothetical protein EVAR_83930_1 [Eumeta japonica]|uniref:Uncharacterized protein n=1 Tax=Eumeta variegata TaxID=151549 RepID=A0A4C1XSK8_EUMVA|nr:hypothetical protein EVAR_83930_1 [Eumeta japonica]
MNIAEQENVSVPASQLSETDTSSTSPTHTWDHSTNENLIENSYGRERIDEEVGILLDIIQPHPEGDIRKNILNRFSNSSVLIRSHPRSFKPFGAHHLGELEEHTTVKYWREVPTKLNVANDATRGPLIDFNETHRWFRDPDFLRKNEDKRLQEIIENEQPAREERSCTTLTLVNEEISTEALLLLKAQKCFEKKTTLIGEDKAVTHLRKLALGIDKNGVLCLKGRYGCHLR